MFKGLFLSAVLLFCGDCKAEEKKCVVECKITLDADEYIHQHKEIYIKASIVPEIINKTHKDIPLIPAFENWSIIEYKVFIYAECESCGGLYVVDVGCSNPNCRNNPKIN